MTDQHEYFATYWQGRVDELWRQAAGGGDLEFLSLVDWSWHRAVPGEHPRIMPQPGELVPIPPEEAARLANDRQHWVSYWAWYLDVPTGGDRPGTVVRRRRSPELLLDELFVVENRWEPTKVLIDVELGDPSDPPHLVEIDEETAEQILQDVRGVEGATRL